MLNFISTGIRVCQPGAASCLLFTIALITAMNLRAHTDQAEALRASVDTACTALTDTGWLVGLQQVGACAFLGIPYASPPTGDLRWRSPDPVAPWTGVKPARTAPPPCPYSRDNQNVVGFEDCLYLNVWRPEPLDPGETLPVLFFIHGGGNIQGSSMERIDQVLDVTGGPILYSGRLPAVRGRQIVVTINYRLGALGFMAHPALLAGSETGSIGNYGLMDQLAALDWFRRNAAVLGGDPARITIVGQSAGAVDVCALMSSPQAAGLFNGAIMMSGYCDLIPVEEIAVYSRRLVREVGCADAVDVPACMRLSVSAEALVLARSARPFGVDDFPFNPSIDGYIGLDQPESVFARGEHNRVPFMLGTTAGELATRFRNLSVSGYVLNLAILAEGDLQVLLELLALYPLSGFASPTEAVVAANTDASLTCPARRYARLVSAGQSEPVWRYHFRRVLSAPERKADAAYHTTDLLYLFQHMDGQFFGADDDDRVVEALMLDYWTAFIAGGNPNGGARPLWPAYQAGVDPYQVLDVDAHDDAGLFTERCDFWDTLQALPQPGRDDGAP